MATERRPAASRRRVVALGVWASDVTDALGYRLPLGVKRGYHMHYGAKGSAALNRPVSRSRKGLHHHADGARRPPDDRARNSRAATIRPPAPISTASSRSPASCSRSPSGATRSPGWGAGRACPTWLPVIGPAPRHKGLWFDFGHQHLGLTLGPVSGLLLAQMMAGETPFVDPEPFRAERFG